MARRQPPRENPLRVLFDYLDDGILKDPEKLAGMVKRQKRMLQSAYHPDSNRDGPFTNEEAEARSKTINGSNELDLLTEALELATGSKSESFEGEARSATRVLDAWIEDYRSNRGGNGELNQKYQTALRQVSSLTEDLRQSRIQISRLEEMLRERRTTSSGARSGGETSGSSYRTRSSGYSSRTESSRSSSTREGDITDKIRELVTSAESALDSRVYSTDTQKYDIMTRRISEARNLSRDNGINFERLFAYDVGRIFTAFVESKVSAAESALDSRVYSTDTQKYDIMTRRISEAKDVASEQGINFEREFGYRVRTMFTKFVESKVSAAESALDSRVYSTDTQKYDIMTRRISEAKDVASEQRINFEREFGRYVSELVSRFVENVLSDTDYSIRELREDSFTSKIDNAVRAAEEFRQTRSLRPKINSVVESFVNVAINRGAETTYSPERYFDMATRVGAKYGVRVNIPHR